MMTEILHLIATLLAGVLLGGIFFIGLWWTIRNSLTSVYPGLWFLTSFLIRITIVSSGFYWIAAGSWQTFLSCLAGFFISRFLSIRYNQLGNKKAIE